MPSAGPRAFRSSRAFLVRSVDVGESDRRIFLFTEEHGPVAMMGKAARRSRKRFGGTLQKYLLLDVGWTESPGRMAVLGQASLVESFWAIAEDWERVRHADYLLELTSTLFPQPGPKHKAFGLLLASLRSLAQGHDPPAVGRKVEAAFLALGGWGPDLSACKRCGRPVDDPGSVGRGPLRFLPAEGGLLCPGCSGRTGVPLSLGAVKTWKVLQASAPGVFGRLRISEIILEELRMVIHQYLEFHVGVPVRVPAVRPPSAKP